MNADLINAVKAAIENNDTSAIEIPQGPVRFKFLALEKFGDSEPVITGFHPETGATARFEDQDILEQLKALGAKPAEKKTIEIETEDGPREITRRRIEGFAVEAVITNISKKKTSKDKERIRATVRDAKAVKAGLELDGDWAL